MPELSNFKYTLSASGEGRVQFSTDNSTWKNSEGDTLDVGAYSFDGINDYIDFGNIAQTLNTISFWVKADDATSENILDFDGGTHTITIDGSDDVTANGFTSPTYFVDGVSGVRAITNNEWHHVAVTTATGFTVSDFDVGRISASYFTGSISDVRIYSEALSSASILSLYENSINPDDTNLEGWWKLSGDVLDSSTNSNHGTNYGATSLTDWTDSPIIGHTLTDGGQQTIDISALGDASEFYYRVFLTDNSSIDEVTLEYLADGS